MKKLSDYKGQEHITSILRASIIKNEHIKTLSISGEPNLASQIFNSYVQSVCCVQPNRGDACQECQQCLWYAVIPCNINFCDQWSDNAVNFQLKIESGFVTDPDILKLLIYSFQSSKTDVLKFIKKFSLQTTFATFCQEYLQLLLNLIYLKSNFEIKDSDNIEALRALSARISVHDLTACIRILRDAQRSIVLSDAINIESVSLLIAEALSPTPLPEHHEIWVEGPTEPIKVIESNHLEQPLSLEEMLELAHS